MENSNKKSLKWLWIAITIVAVVGVGVWCAISAMNANGAASTFKFSSTFVMFTLVFVILALGYLLGGINIKGVSLGTAGVFLVAILLGWLNRILAENTGRDIAVIERDTDRDNYMSADEARAYGLIDRVFTRR